MFSILFLLVFDALVAVGFITVVMAPIWHMALHNTNLYGTLVRSYSLGCCSQSSVEASGLNLFMYKLFGLVHICCHLGLYIFVAIWAIARPANNYYYYDVLICSLLAILGL